MKTPGCLFSLAVLLPSSGGGGCLAFTWQSNIISSSSPCLRRNSGKNTLCALPAVLESVRNPFGGYMPQRLKEQETLRPVKEVGGTKNPDIAHLLSQLETLEEKSSDFLTSLVEEVSAIKTEVGDLKAVLTEAAPLTYTPPASPVLKRHEENLFQNGQHHHHHQQQQQQQQQYQQLPSQEQIASDYRMPLEGVTQLRSQLMVSNVASNLQEKVNKMEVALGGEGRRSDFVQNQIAAAREESLTDYLVDCQTPQLNTASTFQARARQFGAEHNNPWAGNAASYNYQPSSTQEEELYLIDCGNVEQITSTHFHEKMMQAEGDFLVDSEPLDRRDSIFDAKLRQFGGSIRRGYHDRFVARPKHVEPDCLVDLAAVKPVVENKVVASNYFQEQQQLQETGAGAAEEVVGIQNSWIPYRKPEPECLVDLRAAY